MKKTSVLLLITLLLAGLTLASCEKEKHPDGSGTLAGFNENGASDALFSVSTTKRVRFSRGNLQYDISSAKWSFARHQYEYTGSYSTTMFDLFGWGTSGWYNPAQSHDPTSISNWNPDYWVGGGAENDLVGICDSADWGVYNAIINGGNKDGMWRTLTMKEWQFLLGVTADTNRIDKWATATIVSGYRGLIILPDVWECPEGITFTPGARGWNTNTYSGDQWSKMEAAGAIFLPAAGCRYVNVVDDEGEAGYYWSATHFDSDRSYCMKISANDMDADSRVFRSNGCSVRLVMDY